MVRPAYRLEKAYLDCEPPLNVIPPPY
jgi:hypothetical protein